MRRTEHTVVSRLRTTDTFREAWATLVSAPIKSAVTAVGITLAAAAYVTTIGLATTLSHQVSETFDATRATEVVVHPPEGSAGMAYVNTEQRSTSVCPSLDTANASRMAGVRSAGSVTIIRSLPVTRTDLDDTATTPISVAGVDSGSLGSIAPHLVAGRSFDGGHVQRSDPEALVPASIASQLGLAGVGDSLVVDGVRLTVLGIFDDVVHRPETLGAILIPATILDTQLRSFSADQVTCEATISTAPGAASQVAAQAAFALDPGQPGQLTVTAPPDPEDFRRKIEGPIRSLSLALATAVLLLGAISIATTASSNVASRTSELGLRKALGARPRHLFSQLVLETTIIGLLAGTAGDVVGLGVVLGVSFAHDWTVVIDSRFSLAVCVGAAIVGAIAGLAPAARAARLPPVEALRR